MCGNLIKQRNSEAQVLPVAVYFKMIFKDWDPWLNNTLEHTYITMRRMCLNALTYRQGMEGPVEQVCGSGIC